MMSTTEYATKPRQYNLPMVQGVPQGPIIAAHLQCTNGEEVTATSNNLQCPLVDTLQKQET